MMAKEPVRLNQINVERVPVELEGQPAQTVIRFGGHVTYIVTRNGEAFTSHNETISIDELLTAGDRRQLLALVKKLEEAIDARDA